MSLWYDAVNDYLTLAANIVAGTNDCGVAAWIKADSTQPNNFPGVLSSSYVGAVDWHCLFLQTDTGLLRLGFCNIYSSPGAVDLRDDKWHHVAIMCDRAANARFYVDGAADGTTNIAAKAAFAAQTRNPKIGVTGSILAQKFAGEIAELAVWVGAAPSAAQVVQLYAGGMLHRIPFTIEAASLYAYWAMNDRPAGAVAAGATVLDAAGAHTATVVGAPVFRAAPVSTLGAGPMSVITPAEEVGGGPFPHFIRRSNALRGGLVGMGV